METLPAFCLLGAPGAGKGTQAQLLKDRLGYLHVSSGDIFRDALAKKDPAALKAPDLMNRGELVPDDVIKEMVQTELGAKLQAAGKISGVILDGFPRTVGQAEMLDGMVSALNLRFTGMVNLQVPEEMLIKRLLNRSTEGAQRADDNEEVIRERMKVWRKKTQPLEDYYAQRQLLINVDGTGTIEEIYVRLAPIVKNM